METKETRPFTPKQERFCQEYLVDFNATQAAIRAGYSAKTAYAIGEQNLRKTEIQLRIQQGRKALADKTEITRERVLQEYANVAFGDIREFFDENNRLKPVQGLSDKAAAALAGVDVDELWGGDIQIGETKKIKRWDKIKALDGISRILGLNAPDKVAQTDSEGKDVKHYTAEQLIEILKNINGTAASATPREGEHI